MSQFSLPSLRLVLFTIQPPFVLNALIETLGQHVLLAAVFPDPSNMYQGIITDASPSQNILVVNDMDQLPAMLSGLAPDLILSLDFPLPFSPSLLALPSLGCV